MQQVDIFIISWAGQHSHAASIADDLAAHGERATIIYSDPGDIGAIFNPHSVMQRNNNLFWADKFLACANACAPESVMFVIHADCTCRDWPAVISLCRRDFSRFGNLGVWTPRLTGTPWRLEKTRICRLPDSHCSIVAHTDGIVFALAPALRDRMLQADYSGNIYGLGLDWMFLCSAYANGKIAILNEGITVHHSVTRGYSSKSARKQKREFLKQLTPAERAEYAQLRAHMQPRKLYVKFLYWLELARASKRINHRLARP